MEWVDNDGGRGVAGFKGDAGDCVVRAIAIATGLDYRTVYKELTRRQQAAHAAKPKRYRNSTARTGIAMDLTKAYLAELGWEWVPVMGFGTGCTMHLRPDEVPPGRVILRLSRHICALINGVIHDTYDPSRDGVRCVYGFWREPEFIRRRGSYGKSNMEN